MRKVGEYILKKTCPRIQEMLRMSGEVKWPERKPDTRERGNSSSTCVQTSMSSFHTEKSDVCGAPSLIVLQFLTVHVLNFAQIMVMSLAAVTSTIRGFCRSLEFRSNDLWSIYSEETVEYCSTISDSASQTSLFQVVHQNILLLCLSFCLLFLSLIIPSIISLCNMRSEVSRI